MPSYGSPTRHDPHEVESEDLERHLSGTPLKLIAIPLYTDGASHPSALDASQGLRAGGSQHVDEKRAIVAAEHDGHDHHRQRPIYKRRTEANSTELFFDLFFVANLTVFTTQHEVDAGESKSCQRKIFVRRISSIRTNVVYSIEVLCPFLHHPLVHVASGHPLRRPIQRRLFVREDLQSAAFRRHDRLRYCRTEDWSSPGRDVGQGATHFDPLS